MRYAIIKNHKSSAAGVSNTIGWIEHDGMTEALLDKLIELDYTIELKPSPKPQPPLQPREGPIFDKQIYEGQQSILNHTNKRDQII